MRKLTSLLSIILFLLTTSLLADPPSRIALLRHVEGQVSLYPAGGEEWIELSPNRPLTMGDKLWNDIETMSEIKLSGLILSIGPETSFGIIHYNDKVAQFKMTQGLISLQVSKIVKNQEYEIDTPNLALSITQPGFYRIEVNPEEDETTVIVRSGTAEIYGEGRSYAIEEQSAYRFRGTALQESKHISLPDLNELEKWNLKNQQANNKIPATPFVSTDMMGYEDLYTYGKWIENEEYGTVWTPTQISKEWAPYREGSWVWIEPWGWTWVGTEPWGFAPYHYGRWLYLKNQWCWIPGPAELFPVYTPALVGFIGGSQFKLASVVKADIAWFPLAPTEIYWPPYEVSQNYFTNVNLSNATINSRIVAQAYLHPDMKINYRNIQFPNSITAVKQDVFVEGKRIEKWISIPEEKITKAPIGQVALVAPEPQSLYDAATTSNQPPENSERLAIAKLKLPLIALPLSKKTSLLKQNPGKPLPNQVLATLISKEEPPSGTQLSSTKKPTRLPPDAKSQSNAWVSSFNPDGQELLGRLRTKKATSKGFYIEEAWRPSDDPKYSRWGRQDRWGREGWGRNSRYSRYGRNERWQYNNRWDRNRRAMGYYREREQHSFPNEDRQRREFDREAWRRAVNRRDF